MRERFCGEHRFGGSCSPDEKRSRGSGESSKGEEHRFDASGGPRMRAAFCGTKQEFVRADRHRVNGRTTALKIIGKDPMRQRVECLGIKGAQTYVMYRMSTFLELHATQPQEGNDPESIRQDSHRRSRVFELTSLGQEARGYRYRE